MYKNWKAIVRIKDTHFMRGLALLDLKSALGRKVTEGLPEYFSEEKQSGPIPLSALFILAEKYAREDGATRNFDCLISFDRYWSREFDIPIFSFCAWEDLDIDDPMLPEEVALQIEKLGRRAEVGDIFTWEGKEIVLLENNDEERGHCGTMGFAPAELIAVDK